jgi:hypothetical protein
MKLEELIEKYNNKHLEKMMNRSEKERTPLEGKIKIR